MKHRQNIGKLAAGANGDLTVRVYMHLFDALSICHLLHDRDLAQIADCLDTVTSGCGAEDRAAALHLIAAVNAYRDVTP